MKRIVPTLILAILWLAPARPASAQQKPDVKFIADTLVVEADGSCETDPDLATLTFNISAQDKELKKAYESATQSVQRIVAVAEKGGLKREDIYTGALTLTPSYDKDRNKKPKNYFVQGEITLKVRDFSQIGPVLDGAVQDGIVDFRSLTYSLQDEEHAKENAAANAMKNAVGRATSALAQNNQKVGAIRYASLDVRQLVGVAQYYGNQVASLTESVMVSAEPANGNRAAAPAPPPPPPVRPQKITVSATVQAAFQIQ
jgi:uncharacterized protein YggE